MEIQKKGVLGNHIALLINGTMVHDLLWSRDMADACAQIVKKVDFDDVYEGHKEIRNTHNSIGTGIGVSIRDLAGMLTQYEETDYKSKLIGISKKQTVL